MERKEWFGVVAMIVSLAGLAWGLGFYEHAVEARIGQQDASFAAFARPMVRAAAIISLSLIVWGSVFFPAWWLLGKLNARCWFGHRKKYVGLSLRSEFRCDVGNHPFHWKRAYVFRWVCDQDRCNACGETCMGDRGAWKVEYGRIAIDEKTWASAGEPKP